MCARKCSVIFHSVPLLVFGFFGVIRRKRHKNKYSFESRFEYLQKYFNKIINGYKVEYFKLGEENMPEKVSFVVANHNATYDPLLMLISLKYPTALTSKIENRKSVFIRTVLESNDAFFIDRQDARQALKISNDICSELLNKKKSIAIYPEGSRNREHPETLLPFKEACFRSAIKAGVSIYPIVTYGTNEIRNFKLKVKRLPIIISYLPPITPEDYAGKTTYEVSDMVHKIMQEELTNHVLPLYKEKMMQKTNPCVRTR